LRGHDYALGQEGAGGAMGIIDFEGTVTMPDLTDTGTAQVSAPFSFSGQLRPEDTGITEPLTGSGVATIDLHVNFDGASWMVTRATYEFAHK
jgi:hypothetical protein